jgi:hypothetical protein
MSFSVAGLLVLTLWSKSWWGGLICQRHWQHGSPLSNFGSNFLGHRLGGQAVSQDQGNVSTPEAPVL